MPVGKLTTADIDDLYGYLVHGGGRDGAPLAPGRVTRIPGVLHRAFAQAVRWEWVWFNPVSNASPPRVPPPEVRPPTVDAVVALLHSVRGNDPCLFAYLQLAASTGARRSQLLGLRWGEIDFAQRSIGFTRAFVEGDDGPVLRATKSHRSYSVAIDEGTLTVLLGHWRQAVARAECVGANLTVDSFVFSSDPAGTRPWLPNRSPNDSSTIGAGPGWATSDSTTCATSWRPRCSHTASPCRPCPNASATPAHRRP